jgi:hypothetical protein
VIDREASKRPSRTAGALAAAGVRSTAVTGVRFALEPGRGRTAVPVRAALAGAVAAVCAVTAVAGYRVLTPGKGGILHLDEMRRLAPDHLLVYPGTFAVRLQPGADWDRAMGRLRRDFPGTMHAPRPHAEVRNLQRVGNLPGLLALLVGVLGLGTMTHTLVTSVRRRRRDLAVLKTLGFVRGPVVPLAAMLAVAAGTVLATNLVAAVPARAASRLQTAAVLRSE